MNSEMLSQVLARFYIDPSSYNLDWREDDANYVEVYAMTHEGDGWHVFYAERGHRKDERTYANEADACDALLIAVAEDHNTRSVR